MPSWLDRLTRRNRPDSESSSLSATVRTESEAPGDVYRVPRQLEDLKGYFPNHWVGQRFALLPDRGDHGVLYVRSPKAASSTILMWLMRLQQNDPEWLPAQMSGWKQSFTKWSELESPDVERMLSGPAFRFTFVRDPLRRFESAWRDKVGHVPRRPNAERAQRKAPLQEILGFPTDTEVEIGFEDFLQAVEQQDPLTEMDLHWRPQHLNLMHPLISYDFIGRLETLDRDLVTLQDAVNFRVPLQSRNIGKPREASVYDGRPDLVRRVQGLFSKDYEIYGY